jgi:hypothetical protein
MSTLNTATVTKTTPALKSTTAPKLTAAPLTAVVSPATTLEPKLITIPQPTPTLITLAPKSTTALPSQPIPPPPPVHHQYTTTNIISWTVSLTLTGGNDPLYPVARRKTDALNTLFYP